MIAQQRAYQAERASATAVANATQLQTEVLRLSDQLDALREASEAQSSVVQSQQVQASISNGACRAVLHLSQISSCMCGGVLRYKLILALPGLIASLLDNMP